MAKTQDTWSDAAANAPWSRLIPPAPGELRIVQAFVNTFDKDAKTDELTSPRALANWFARWGLAFEDDLRLTNSDLEKAIAAREGLRSLIRANGGGNVDPRVVERLDPLASETAFRLRFEGAGAARLESRVGGLDGALGRLFKVVWICESPVCSRAFYDRRTTRNPSAARPRCSRYFRR